MEARKEKFDTGKVQNKSEIGSYWWNEFQTAFNSAYGDNFETEMFSNLMFAHWVKPPIFEETKEFF